MDFPPGVPSNFLRVRILRMTEPWLHPAAIAQSDRILRSYRHWLNQDLLPGIAGSAAARALFELPRVVVSHGTEPDPILNYGNQAALALWEMNWEQITATPSRFTAEPVARDERARLLAEVTRNGYIADYAGVRISRTGRRFRISQAIVWTLIDDDGHPAGQAATFDRWEFL